MEADFWHARWQRGEIGFHLGEPNPILVRHHARLGAAAGSRVLVPLCGKSQDLAWLASHGYAVIGVELSELAVRAFFEENGIKPEISQVGTSRRFHAGTIDIVCGDFFELGVAELGRITALYDRAALIALPPPMRAAYAQHVATLVPAGARGLLVTLEQEPHTDSGPPFSVLKSEVRALYEPAFEVASVEHLAIEVEPRFKQRGIVALYEHAYSLARR